ncbi:MULTISPECIES: nucleoside hydrolase [Pseudomonas syringae group]|uniref:Inosine/uridine-preferring nucleoside hydrolase n=2 Tax=Pseudomonas syringae group genomosp. 3 TaxID=251701 RepID=A0A3M5RP41_9PSED|nr:MULTISPECIES: nucleoside hydrolase [Pseudomonas syringae group]PHN60303.1 nucleoside hydrolase [Pseudomonas syringae]RMR31900.1 Inosine/uridine-preferring nucleoside hydrolase [Pseudomonas syringae pv. coriandricola]RMU10648.1 Inosine/uridine-preferring nucleoside hydrolase [Pseudomonas syringae pv. coriandricola]SOQ13248.1 purine nucleosidase [Pseudomonas syringae pv. persicae]SOQ13865.1 purine nucleosidase [Pseudomonas syringae pv. persicae]
MKSVFKQCAMLAALACSAGSVQAAEKVIFDTDFNVLNDDGQAFIMLAQLHSQKRIELLGMTLVSGNAWVDQEQVDALKAVERMGVEKDVGVYSGAVYPLLHDFATYPQEQALFGAGFPGAFKSARPTSAAQLISPPDGLATRTQLRKETAVQFIIDSVRAHPHEVTLLATGPLTNLALAIRQAPDIVPLIKRIVYMGGAMEIPGNTTPAAEFNWWFDPEAAKIVLRSPIEHVIFPNDVCEKVTFDASVYQRIVAHKGAIADLYTHEFGPLFAKNPDYHHFTWDSLPALYLVEPNIVTESRELNVDVDATFGPDYGRSLAYKKSAPVGTQKATVVFGINQKMFWDGYVSLVTLPTPVKRP